MPISKIKTSSITADAASINLNIDAGTLFLDVANNAAGIGTGSSVVSASRLTLNSGSFASLWSRNDPTLGYSQFYFGNEPTNASPQSGYQFLRADGRSSGWISLGTADTERIRITSSGQLQVFGTGSSTVRDAEFDLKGGRAKFNNYLTIARGPNNNDGLFFNVTPSADGTTYTPNYIGNSGAGSAFIGMPSGGNGGLLFKVYRHGTSASTYTESTMTTAMSIADGGNIGIGISSPSTKVHGVALQDEAFSLTTFSPVRAAIAENKSEFRVFNFSVNSTSNFVISNIVTSSSGWRVIFRGTWSNNFEGGGLTPPPAYVEVNAANPTVTVGSRTLTVSRNGSGYLQVNGSDAYYISFAGSAHIYDNPQSSQATTSLRLLGHIATSSGEVQMSQHRIRSYINSGTLGECTIESIGNVNGGYVKILNDGAVGGVRGVRLGVHGNGSSPDSGGTDTLVVNDGGNVVISDGASSQYSAKLYVNGAIACRHSGVDGSPLPAWTAGYTSNYTEKNIISTSVSSSAGNSGFYFYVSDGAGSANTTLSLKVNRGSCQVIGSLSKGSGSFKIDHPLPEKENTHHLVHSFIEGPQADLIYRGKVVLVNGRADVNVDIASGMTDGTFVVLCREVQCFTTNETGWTAVRGKVTGNMLAIEAQDNTCTDEISWMVIGERQDKHMIDTGWTDENGKVIVEPEKPAINAPMSAIIPEPEELNLDSEPTSTDGE